MRVGVPYRTREKTPVSDKIHPLTQQLSKEGRAQSPRRENGSNSFPRTAKPTRY